MNFLCIMPKILLCFLQVKICKCTFIEFILKYQYKSCRMSLTNTLKCI